MMYLGQLLDVLPDNELVTLRSAGHTPVVYFEESTIGFIKKGLTKEARQCSIAYMYSDVQTDSYGRATGNSYQVIEIRPNGHFIRNGDVTT